MLDTLFGFSPSPSPPPNDTPPIRTPTFFLKALFRGSGAEEKDEGLTEGMGGGRSA